MGIQSLRRSQPNFMKILISQVKEKWRKLKYLTKGKKKSSSRDKEA
jgi:hypothetical protein